MIKEYIYFDYGNPEDGNDPVISHSTRNTPDKYADNMGVVIIEGHEDELDMVLDKIFPTR